VKEKENDFVKLRGNARKNVCVREEWKWKKRMEKTRGEWKTEKK